MPELDLSERELRFHWKGENVGPVKIEVPAHAAPVPIESAKCKYSSRRKELVIEWPLQDSDIEQSNAKPSPCAVGKADNAQVTTEQAAADPQRDAPHASLMVVPGVADGSSKSVAAEPGAPAIASEDPIIQEAPPAEPEVSADEWKARGNAAIKEGDFESAVAHYTAGLAAPGASGDAEAMLCSNRSLSFQKLGRHEEALADAERCMRLKPDFVKGFLRAATSFRALGRPCEALAALKRAPNHDEACAMAAEIRPEAEAAEKARIAALPPAEKALAEADALFVKGLFEAAAVRYADVIGMCDAPDGQLALAARTGRAGCRHQLSDFSGVVEDTSFVLEKDPMNVEALTRRMLALEPMEKYKAALADARSVLNQQPRHVIANKVQHRLSKLVRELEREQSRA
eukprot:TRINITY_DN20891_c0_g1_i1.p1 TRINITY_DN20891_c0_g1~~TRINITY_DN20891_c0_g1_i1.p1  ORF type:complete len:454 (+),score=98.11 TRINITY_DN20891_c0_g1_i1:161-1363(+)